MAIGSEDFIKGERKSGGGASTESIVCFNKNLWTSVSYIDSTTISTHREMPLPFMMN